MESDALVQMFKQRGVGTAITSTYQVRHHHLQHGEINHGKRDNEQATCADHNISTAQQTAWKF